MSLSQAEIDEAKVLIPRAFKQPLAVRIRVSLIRIFFVSVIAYCLWAFDFSPERILTGFERFGRVLKFMFPPHIWDNWADFSQILKGLGETLSIAFLGTLLGAIFAFPAFLSGGQEYQPI
ncbi:hypothetical protein [uncultured Cohaesibacter sp.]|uniref:PhnE/PtxC family ABC transporter permease n=1 Tax=uncultured Cohaesibacter sp. TaxID=1002546 RepID=UPI00292ECB1D|nr:hypothetical protein [uncultured Cohaesibacter sp.]